MKYIYIDLDGVILDSEIRMLKRKYEHGFSSKDEKSFHDYFSYTNSHPEEWDYIIREAHSINNSLEIIKELQTKKDNIAILTKVHTMYEMETKVDDLRNNRKITVPIFFVPGNIMKHKFVKPNGQILIDDSSKNIIGWNKFGGEGYLFKPDLKREEKGKVKSLEFLLKR